jgi:hypothetical protein
MALGLVGLCTCVPYDTITKLMSRKKNHFLFFLFWRAINDFCVTSKSKFTIFHALLIFLNCLLNYNIISSSVHNHSRRGM